MSWKDIVSSVAPMIGTAIGGPISGAAVGLALKAFGIEPSKNSQENEQFLENAIASATPDQLLALRKADNDFKIQMSELGLKSEDLIQKDRSNARSREIEVGGYAVPVLAGLVISGWFGSITAVLFGATEGMNDIQMNMVYMLMGALGGGFTQVLSYYFGSSSGQNHALLSNSTKTSAKA